MPKLNVILHGLFALVEREDQILALAPDLGGQHVFRAGSWLGEAELRRGFYSLTGVSGGSAQFDTTRNLVLTGKQMAPGAVMTAHATILLRRPKEIFSVRPVDIIAGDFTGDDAGAVGSKMATIQILVYDSDDLTQVTLAGHPWTPPQTPGLSITNLHIFSEEDSHPTVEDHPLNAFQQTLAMFVGVDLQLTTPKPVPSLQAGELLPEGVIRLEVEDLAHRQGRMEELGQLLPDVLRAGSFDGLKEVWPDGEPRAGKLTSCSFPIVRT